MAQSHHAIQPYQPSLNAQHGGYAIQPYQPHQQLHVWTCPYCRAQGTLGHRSTTSTAGWIVFWFLALFSCFLLAPLGLLFKEHHQFCKNCYAQLA